MSKFVLTAQLQLQAPNNVGQVVQQIQNQLNGINVNIQVQGSQQAQKQIQQVTQSTNQATTAAERMGKAFALSIRRFAAFSIATRGVGLFTSTLSDAIQTAIDFERELVKVSQVTGKSIGQLRGLTREITSLSTGLGVSSKDLLNVTTVLAQAGLTAEDTSRALRILAKSALAPNFDSITETTEGAIAILAQFQEGVGALEAQLGSINAVAGAFAVEAGDLIDVVRRTGGVFKSSGGSLNELLALFTSVRATTRESAESIGTGLRTIFTRIQRPQTIEYLKQFGVELVDLNGKFVGPFEAIKRLSGALSGLGEGDLTFISIAEELGGFRQIGKVLPLLQQFSTAQSALNVAMKSGDSLTQDAASAQAALAIRIMKVREEFLALIRSVTETSTFQVMANTALSLASALIKIGDSIKPLLPMLAALAAFKIAKGLGGFFGGMMSGAASGRAYNKGGKVHHFARGGLVPGTGNRDTVPAMLAPGEFVIRKSSVNKMGAGTLAAMNNNKFAVGGIVQRDNAGMAVADTFGETSTKTSSIPISLSDIAKATPQSGDLKSGSLSSLYSFKNTKTVLPDRPNVLPSSEFNNVLKSTYGLNSKTYTAKTAGISPNNKTNFSNILTEQMQGAIRNGASDWSKSVGVALSPSEINFGEKFSLNPGLAGTFFESIVDAFQGRPIGVEASENKRPFDFTSGLRRGANAKLFSFLNDVDYIDAKKSEIGTRDTEYKKKISNQLAIDGADEVSQAVRSKYQQLLNITKTSDTVQKKYFGGIIQKFAEGGMAEIPNLIKRGTLSYRLEDILKAGLTPAQFLEQIPVPPPLMAVNPKPGEYGTQFKVGGIGAGSVPMPKFLKPYTPPDSAAFQSSQDAVLKRSEEAVEYRRKKGLMPRDYEGKSSTEKSFLSAKRRGFAAGGGVGTDTVPALLTPGEFVINRKSAQGIGYGALNRMNKVGKYAKGGVVGPQRLFVGGVAEKQVSRDVGFREIDSINDAAKVMAETLDGLGPEIKKAILDKFKGIESVSGGGKTSLGTKFKDTTRGQAVVLSSGASAMGLQIKGKKVAANTNTVAHETGHLADSALAGKKGFASTTKGTFQFDLVEKVKPQMEAAFKAAGMSAKQIETYLASNQELFAEFFAKASPEVRAIITSTTDSKIGMEKLAEHLEKAGHTYAGLEASDITGVKPPPVTPPKKPSVPSSGGGGGPPDDTTQGYIKKMTATVKDRTQVLEQAKQEEQKALAQSSKHTNAIKALEAKLVKSSSSYDVNQNLKLQQQIKHHTDKLKEASQKTDAVSVAEKRLAASVKRRAELIDQARVEKASATTARQSTLQGGTPSTFRGFDSSIQLQKQKEAAQAAQAKKEAAQAKKQAARNQSSFGSGGMMPKDIGGAAIAVSMVTSSLQAMLPPLDENSSALTKVSHSFLGLVTTVAGVAFALQSFGVTIKAQSAMKFLGGGGLSPDGMQSIFSAVKGMGGSTNLAGNIAGVANGFAKMAGPIAAVVGGLWLAKQATDMFVEALFGSSQKRKEAAIQKGDVAEAGKQASIQSDRSTFGSGLFGGAAVGTILGGLVGGIAGAFGGPIGTAIGIKVGASVGAIIGTSISTIFAGDFANEAANTAMAMAANTKASNDLQHAQTQAALAAEKFKNGAISASEYLDTFSQASKSVQESRKFTDAVVKQSTEGKSEVGSGAILRNLGAYLGGGLFGMETAATRNTRLTTESTDAVKGQRENEAKLFDSSAEARNATIRSTIARGGSVEDAQAIIKTKTGLDSEDMRRRASSLGFQAEKARSSGDVKLAAELDTQSKQLFAQANQLEDSFVNIAKEVQRAKDSFEAMNLGLRSATATATALSAGMDRFSAGLEVGGSTFVSDVEFLQQSLSSAAQSMDPAEIKGAMKNVSDNLSQFGVSPQQIAKFEGNINAFTQAQANYNKAFDNIKQSMADVDFKKLSSDDLKKKFADELTKGMGDGEAKENLKKVINGLELETGDVDKILAGDLSVFGDKLTESQKKMFEDIEKIAAERAKAEQVLIDFTKKRIDAERNLVQAQQEALDLTMEGREIQGKYGGRAVTGQERKDNLLAKSNVEGNRLGLSAMNTGDVGDLRRRNAEIKAGFSNIESRRSQQGGMSNKEGVSADETQKDLQKAYKTQIDTIRGLIKLEEDQLKIIEEKNKLEKESMESLVKGDIEEFFKKQSAVGATAAIASGDTRLQNLYGAEALGTAAMDIKRQQDAGVQTLYGQQLAGPGGLTEAASSAALSSRGITDMRSAQVMAGTTAEEEASKTRLRELGGMLGETGQLGTELSTMEVNTAVVNLNTAELKFKETMDRGNKAAEETRRIEGRTAAQSLNKGGVVYANRGIFVPRGTDTVPAMLTPGEFVVNRAAVQRGNNLQMLQSMNNGLGSVSNSGGTALMATGGMVRYRSEGSNGAEQPSQGMSSFTNALENFNRELTKNVQSLRDTKISIKLDSTSISVNLNDGGLLKALTSQVKTEIFNLVKNNLVAGDGGKLRESSSVLT
jgi:TP901 family phage tail tape measure protein